MSKSTLKHFISKNQSSSAKIITREKVKKNSESSRFLKRVNLPENKQICHKPLDMRGKAPGPYREVLHNDKILYLDDLSFLIFQQGLKENNNNFTIGSYNRILYGQHSYMGQDSLKPENEKNHGLNLLIKDQKRAQIIDKTQRENIVGNYSPDILALDYSSKRKENRLIYVMPISLIYQEKQYQLKSRDFSISGLKVFLPRTFFISGHTVKLNFDHFIEKHNQLTDSSGSRFFKNISYKIVDVQHINDKTYLSLIETDLNDYAKKEFSKFIEGNRVQYKLDASDILTASRAKYVEHIYTHNLSSIPVFLSQEKNQYRINHIIQTTNNEKIFSFFKAPKSTTLKHDFSPFRVKQRLQTFAKLALENKSALLFVFWEKDKLYSICDFEFNSSDDLAFIALKIIAQKGKVFYLNCKAIKKPQASFLKSIASHLFNLEQKLSAKILSETETIMAQLLLTDVSEVFQYESYFSLYVTKNESLSLSTTVYSKDNKQQFVDFTPQLLSLNIHKVRYKTRYIYAIPIQLAWNENAFNAETIDFSEDGIGVKLALEFKSKVVNKQEVFVSFPSFATKIKDINFNKIEYKIARIIEHKDYLELGLVRLNAKKNKQLGQFFSQLINRNKSKLDICINDRIEDTLEHLMDAYIESNINSIPLIISRDKQQGHYLKYVGLTEVACQLAEHFYLKLRGYNFKILTSDERLEQLYTRSLRSNNINYKEQDQSFILFMYKDINEQGNEFLNSFTSFEIVYQGETLNLLAKLFENNGVCVKFSFINTMQADPKEIEKIYAMIALVNRQHASLFKHELTDIIGLVDMVDVTSAYRKIYELQQ